MNEEAMRRAFEAWAEDRLGGAGWAKGHEWEAWQAATRAAVPAWRPIETAPKDKTVMLFHEEYAVPLTGTHGAGDIWVAMVPGVPMLFQPVLKPAPTHWMPLPAAPEVKP